MHAISDTVHPALHQLLDDCPHGGSAPVEIHGARGMGCQPGDDFLFQGHRYILDTSRDVLVREDIRNWLLA
ncbi:hypothetical protein HSX11_29915, partial [Oxalobacteraceae bacterium]|nr:hypothetical protein [Oxalobacteraceae bacterium]